METKADKKRRRSKNFAEEEKELLLIIVQDYKEIIDNKRTDAESCKAKNETWDKIAKKFNEYAYEARDGKQLKIFHDNYKARIKKYPLNDTPINNLLSDYEKELLLSLINNHQKSNNLLKFDNIQHKIWIVITHEFNKLTNRFPRKLLELYIFYKNYTENFDNKTITSNVSVNVKVEPNKSEECSENLNEESKHLSTNLNNTQTDNCTPETNDVTPNTDDSSSYKRNNFLQKCVNLKEKHKLKMELLQIELEFKKKELILKQECVAVERQIKNKELQIKDIEIETKMIKLKAMKHNNNNL